MRHNAHTHLAEIGEAGLLEAIQRAATDLPIGDEFRDAAAVIGTFVSPEEGRQVITDGGSVPLAAQGWDHFREGMRW